jgi:hypothetical protein
VLANLGRPGLILDRVWPGRKLAACVTHLGGLRGSAAAVAARSGGGGSALRCSLVNMLVRSSGHGTGLKRACARA